MAKPNRTAFLGRTTSWARWERTSRRLGRRGKSVSLVSRVPDAEGRRQVAVSAENDAAGRVVELRHARSSLRPSVAIASRVMTGSTSGWSCVSACRLMITTTERSWSWRSSVNSQAAPSTRSCDSGRGPPAIRQGVGGRTRACWSTPTPWRADLRRPTAALAVAVTVEPDAAPVTAFAPAHSAQEDRGQGNRCQYQDRHATENIAWAWGGVTRLRCG